MTLENLRDAANLLPHEIGFTLGTSLSNVSIQEALSLFVVAAEQPENLDLATLMRSYADSLTPRYFLVVVAGKVEVLYGLRPCHEIAGNGTRYLALMGERMMVAGMMSHPKIYPLRGQLNAKSQAVGRHDVAAPTRADIEAAFDANADLELVDALQADANGVAAPRVAAWRMLPIHPKFAFLFLRGKTLREAVELGRNLEMIIPQEQRGQLVSFQNFIRVAVTSNGGANPASTLATGWSRVDHSATPGFESWYYELVASMAPTVAAIYTAGSSSSPSNGDSRRCEHRGGAARSDYRPKETRCRQGFLPPRTGQVISRNRFRTPFRGADGSRPPVLLAVFQALSEEPYHRAGLSGGVPRPKLPYW
jgi:hypothetical protein